MRTLLQTGAGCGAPVWRSTEFSLLPGATSARVTLTATAVVPAIRIPVRWTANGEGEAESAILKAAEVRSNWPKKRPG